MQGLTLSCYGEIEIVAVGSPECQCVCEGGGGRERELWYGDIAAVGSPECVCVCKVMRAEREGVQMLELDGQNSCDH